MSVIPRAPSLPGRVAPLVRLAGKCTALFAMVLALSYWIVLSDQVDELAVAEAKEEQLRTTFLDKKKMAINLVAYRRQLEEVEIQFGILIRRLPGTYQGAYEKVARAATAHGLRIEQMSVSGSEQQRDFYAELPASLKLAGSFHDLGAFLNDLVDLGSLMTVGDFRLDAAPFSGVVSMEASVSAFRYLDEEELAAQRKAAQKKRASKK